MPEALLQWTSEVCSGLSLFENDKARFAEGKQATLIWVQTVFCSFDMSISGGVRSVILITDTGMNITTVCMYPTWQGAQ